MSEVYELQVILRQLRTSELTVKGEEGNYELIHRFMGLSCNILTTKLVHITVTSD